MKYHVLKSFPNSQLEFVTTLDYEWNVIRGHQPYRWTIWVRDDGGLTLYSPGLNLSLRKIYSVSRLSGLAVIILTLVSFNTTSEINCQVSAVFYTCLITRIDLPQLRLGSLLVG